MLNYTPKITHASRISEVRDRYGALHPTTINTLLAENLLQALSTSLKATDDRSLVLEIMSCLGILQPRAIPSLIPDLPNLIMSELKHALKSRDSARDVNSTNVSAGLLFLDSTMHMSGSWMERYWGYGRANGRVCQEWRNIAGTERNGSCFGGDQGLKRESYSCTPNYQLSISCKICTLLIVPDSTK